MKKIKGIARQFRRGSLLLGCMLCMGLQFFPGFSIDAIAVEEESARNVAVAGYIRDAANGEELIGATVYVKELRSGGVTNMYGFYSVSLTPGAYTLVFSYMGYGSVERRLELKQNMTLNIDLVADSKLLEEVVVRTERRDANVTRNEMSVEKLQMQTIRRIPALMGEVDLIKAIQLLPGVQSTSEGTSGFSVRGGSHDQNLIIIDEAVVYNASHLIGFFSVFNNDAIKDVKLYKGDIPPSFGGRLSSVLDVRMKDGNSKEFAGNGGIGTISSRLTLEGPIIKDRTSYLVSGRRTYLDVFTALSSNDALKDNKLYFYDGNLKVNHRINENNRLFLSGYFGRDKFSNQFANMGFGNQTVTLRWNHLFSKRLFSNFSLVRSKYDYELGTPSGQANSFLWESMLENHSAKADFTWYPNPSNMVKFGAIGTYHTFDPGKAKGVGSESIIGELKVPDNYALDYAFYLSNEQVLAERLTVKYGLRYNIFQNIGKGTIYNYNDRFQSIDSTVYASGDLFNTYTGLEPRLGLNYLLNEKSSIKASYSRTYQFIHLASNSTGGMPLDLWFPSSPNVKPQRADQYALGYFRNYFNNYLESSVEVYYKKMDQVVDFKDHANLLLNPKLEGELRFGKGEAYGAEFMIRKNEGKLNGWVSYTLSRTERRIPEIMSGKTYLAPYDKPHSIAIVLNYDLNKRVSIAGNWLYATGAPVTFPTGRMVFQGVVLPIYSDRNAYRLPDYHRLDLSCTILGREKPGKRWRGEWNISVYNAYARKNTWAISFTQDKENPYKMNAEKIYLFSIVPAVTYNFYF